MDWRRQAPTVPASGPAVRPDPEGGPRSPPSATSTACNPAAAPSRPRATYIGAPSRLRPPKSIPAAASEAAAPGAIVPIAGSAHVVRLLV